MATLSTPTKPTATTVTIRHAMNDHGTTTVEVMGTNETRHLVNYASDDLQSTLRSLPVGTTIPVEMTRVGGRSNVWRVCGFAGVPAVSQP